MDDPAAHCTVAEVPDTVTDVMVGVPGATGDGVTAFDALDGGPVPKSLIAATVKV